MKPFFDTNLMVYAIAKDDARAEVAEKLLAGGGVVSVQVFNEFTTVARRKLKMDWAEIEDTLAEFLVFCPDPLPVTLETHRKALTLSQRYALSFYDALLVSAALLAGCTTLYSEDMQHGLKVDGQLIVQNPFA